MSADSPSSASQAEAARADIRGSLVRDLARAPVGRVRDVLLAPDTLDARWLQVIVDADESSVLVPAAAASEVAPGELLVPYAREVITSAQHAGGSALTESDAARLLRHYGFSDQAGDEI